MEEIGKQSTMLGKRTFESGPEDEAARNENAAKSLRKMNMKYREWSEGLDPSSALATVFTVKVMFRDPEEKLPSFFKQWKKEEIIKQMKFENFSDEDCTGSKAELLHKLQYNRPYVTFEIDGREGLQRVLAIALTQWDWSLEHLYEAKLPSHCTVKHLYGSSFEPGNLLELGPSDNDTFFSLIDLKLRPGDRVKITHDFGSPQLFIVEVLDKKKGRPLLPETELDDDNPYDTARMEITGKSKQGPPSQYGHESEDDEDGDDNEDEEG